MPITQVFLKNIDTCDFLVPLRAKKLYEISMANLLKSPAITLICVLQALSSEIKQTPLEPASAREETLFRSRAPEETGVNFINPIDDNHELKRLYISGFAAGGVSLGDLDQDGLLDVVLTAGARASKIFRQVSPWKFEEVSWDPKLSELWSSGAAILDIDNDGDLDIYLCNYDTANSLYINVTKPGGTIEFNWNFPLSN